MNVVNVEPACCECGTTIGPNERAVVVVLRDRAGTPAACAAHVACAEVLAESPAAVPDGRDRPVTGRA